MLRLTSCFYMNIIPISRVLYIPMQMGFRRAPKRITCKCTQIHIYTDKHTDTHIPCGMWGGRGPLIVIVWSVSCMQSSFFRYHFDPMQHDSWLLHGHWFLVLVTLALWSSALGPWLYPCMHCSWFPGPWVLLLDSWSLALGPTCVTVLHADGGENEPLYTFNSHAF